MKLEYGVRLRIMKDLKTGEYTTTIIGEIEHQV